jgi:hypothetical protein
VDPYGGLAELYHLFGKDKDIQAFYAEWRESLLEAAQPADAVTCHFDALNHILTADDMQRVLLNV